jgi:dihydroceramidase
MTPGYWGSVTSTIDWCEANYVRSSYVCEWFNTLSSLAMVLAGALGVWLHRGVLERRFHAAFVAVTVVGLGSIAFHATLRRELQMMDELPMLYSALIMVFILIENLSTPRFGRWFPALLVAHGMLVTYLSSATQGALQFYLFHLSFGSMEVFALAGVCRIRWGSKSPVVRRLFALGMGSYAIAVAAWFADLKLCDVFGVKLPSLGIPNPELHAVWHVLVSCGLYLLTLVVAFDRLERLNRKPQLRRRLGFVPRVECERASPHVA